LLPIRGSVDCAIGAIGLALMILTDAARVAERIASVVLFPGLLHGRRTLQKTPLNGGPGKTKEGRDTAPAIFKACRNFATAAAQENEEAFAAGIRQRASGGACA
jgi:hypothetical protein